jgi:hypothetical protein
MSTWSQGPGWWQASDGRWYPPETHPNALPPPPPGGGPSGPPSSRPSRRVVWLGVVLPVSVVLILVVVLVVVSLGGPGRTVATFAPVSASASPRQLADDADQLTRRLDTLGDGSASVAVRGRTVVVRGGTSKLPVPEAELLAPGTLQMRPALCQVAPYTPPSKGENLGPLPRRCSAPRYSLMSPNLAVNVSSGTSNQSSIGFDPVLAMYRSSTPSFSDDNPRLPVLVPLANGGGQRLLLGPSEMGGAAVTDAQAVFVAPSWVVNMTLSGRGSTEWDALSRKYFHEVIGVDVDGVVVSDPLTLPSQATWTSFAGRVQISGSFTRQAAEELAASLDSGPFATPLRVGP